MQHPDKIIHMGTEYSLTHLKEFVDFFDWKLSDGRHVTFRMAVRFADHCYTDERLPLVDGCYTVPGKRKPRVFCTDRHVRSFQVPAIVRGLFSKPAQTISMTMENNWATFCLQMKPAIPRGKRYYVFFRVQFLGGDPNIDPLPMDLYIESAYVKDVQVRFRRLAPFGRIVEEAVFGKQ